MKEHLFIKNVFFTTIVFQSIAREGKKNKRSH